MLDSRQPFNPSRAAEALPTDAELQYRLNEDRIIFEREKLRERQAARRLRNGSSSHSNNAARRSTAAMSDDHDGTSNSTNADFGKSLSSSASINSKKLPSTSPLRLGADGKPLHSEVGLHQGLLYIKGTTYNVDQRVVVSQKHKSFTAVLTELYPTEVRVMFDVFVVFDPFSLSRPLR